MKSFNPKRKLLAAAVISLTMSAATTSAQTLEEVVVTAQKKLENLQDVPTSVGLVDGSDLDRLGLQSMEEISGYIPNFSLQETSSGNTIVIRGVASGTNRGFEQAVGLFVDGVYGGRNKQFSAPFFDLERVEVLRGPQGVLFGKNTIAGAVNVITARPHDEFEVSLDGQLETEFGSERLSMTVNAPLTENLAARFAYRNGNSDTGFLDNSFTGRDERAKDTEIARLSFSWDNGGPLSAFAKYEYSELEQKGTAFQLINFGPYEALYRSADPQVESRLDLNTSGGGGDPAFGLAPVDQSAIRTNNGVINIKYE